jgi:hypothetical protein
VSTSLIVAQCLLDDTHWRAFGYRRRPRRGRLFRRVISTEKLERETVLMQELWAASFSRVFYWAHRRGQFAFRIDFIARLFELCVDGIDQPIWPTLRFHTVDNSISFLVKACRDYGGTEIGNQPSLFLERAASYLTQELPTAWLVGPALLLANPSSLFNGIIVALDQAGVAENPTSDLDIRDLGYRRVAAELFAW